MTCVDCDYDQRDRHCCMQGPPPLTYLSLFSGVGGFDLGADAVGWECVGQVEWDPWCQHVLNRHWPDVPKWGDVRQMDGAHVRADVIAGGFPCQDVSVAGKRAGMGEGTRSGLYAEIIRIIEEMRRATGNQLPRWVVLENVVGLLSIDNGAGFRAVLRDLAEVGALVVEWAMLDSQHFGVPQRRQRIFVVACFDPVAAERCPDPLLPVGSGVRRDSGESGAARQDVAGTLGGGSGSRGWAADTDRMTFVPALTTRCGNTLDDQQTGHLVSAYQCHGSNVGEMGTLRRGNGGLTGGVPFVPTAFHMTQEPISSPDVTPCLGVTSGGMGIAHPVARRGRDGGAEWEIGEPDLYNSLRAGDGGSSRQNAVIAPDLAVRRLTPVECERLQGWPDDHTALTADGRPIADSHRYRMAGNGITANVARWVCEQINAAERAA